MNELSVRCTFCGASPEESCTNLDGSARASHLTRKETWGSWDAVRERDDLLRRSLEALRDLLDDHMVKDVAPCHMQAKARAILSSPTAQSVLGEVKK